MPFDPVQFLNQEYNEPNSTQSIPIPENDYTGLIRSVSPPFVWTDDRDGSKKVFINVNWALEDPDGAIEEKTNRKDNTAQQKLSLEPVLDNMGNVTGIDMRPGINVPLGLLREATNLNTTGFRFNKLIGKAGLVRVRTKIDKNDIPRSQVTAVAPLGGEL